MRKGIYGVVVALLLFVAARTHFEAGSTDSQSLLVTTASAQAANSPCTFPTKAPDPNNARAVAETAWQMFVAANCPANNTQLVWETWIEQSELYPADGKVGPAREKVAIQRLHGSPLAFARMRRLHPSAEITPSECNPMGGPPDNVVAGAWICEEARLNPAAQAFVSQLLPPPPSGQTYQIRPPQTQAAGNGTNIQFPPDAIEIKVDWIPALDFNTPFNCTNPPPDFHVEMIDGICYAMAGIHISSKLLPNWIWATFEPQSMTTNPNRCVTFGPCNDPWGSHPATSNGGAGGFTKPTKALKDLMQQAGLAKEFLNYRLVGAQVAFTNPDGSPTYLGNSVIEGENVGLTPHTVSCITCHSVSSIKNDGTDGITILNDNVRVGEQYVIPTGWIARDFVWSLGLACPDAVIIVNGKKESGGGLQGCTPSK